MTVIYLMMVWKETRSIKIESLFCSMRREKTLEEQFRFKNSIKNLKTGIFIRFGIESCKLQYSNHIKLKVQH